MVYKIEAAELKIRENQRDEGLADLETLLSDLNPSGWLHRDVRRRIEEVFLRGGDQDGLVKYYEQWLQSNKEDVGAMARLARFLASSARVPEASQWMEKALKLAPSRTDLRKAFIDQLVDDQRFSEASEQYEQLVKAAPGNQDYLRDWGRLVLKDKSLDADERRQRAGRIWNQIISIRADDALTNAQVADLYRQANMEDEALALYRKAIELSPNDPQYREYLGEYYHILKRPEEALATWKQIAVEARRNALNVSRLAEVYNSFGYLDQAVKEIADACKLDSKDFALQLKAAEYHSRANKFEEALAFVDTADALAANDEEHEATLNQRIDVFRAARRLEEETDRLASQLEESTDASVTQWHTLARYYEADRRWADATEAVEKALNKDKNSIVALSTAARISEMAGDYARAANMNRKLAAVDGRSRSDHLMNVARLEAQLGKSDEALAAGRDLIVSAPGNTDNYEFYAQLCFQLGKVEDGLDALRKAVRINPTEPALIMSLASALSREFRTDEAIEVYWRAFGKSEEIEDKTTLTQRLTELYLQTNQFDKLLERLERDRRENSKRREMTICLAQAHHSAGDFGTARMELESLLSEDTRDTNLLQQLSKLCEGESDFDGSIDYQRRLVEIAPGHETEFRLAKLLTQQGDHDEASDIYIKLTQREENPVRLLRSLDSLLRQSSYESVIAITEPRLSEQRDDWELLYREGVAWASLNKTAEAKDRFERLLALNIAHDRLGFTAEEKFKQQQARARSNNLRGIQTKMPTHQSPLSLLNQSRQVRTAVGLDADNRYYSGGPPAVWTPDAYGASRMAAYGWLMRFERDADTGPSSSDEDVETTSASFLDQLAEAAAAENADRNTIYDWMYVEQLRSNFDSIFNVARRLASAGGKEEQQFFINSLRLRGMDMGQQQNPSRSRNTKPKKEPLSDSDIELMLTCIQALSEEDERQLQAAFGSGQVLVSGGQTYIMSGGSWIPAPGGISMFALGSVMEELKLAGREDQAEELLNRRIETADNAGQIAAAMSILFSQEEFDGLEELHAKWREAALQEVARGPEAQPNTNRSSRSRRQYVGPLSNYSRFLLQWTGHLGAEEENQQVLAIVDQALDVAVEEGKQRRAQKRKRRSRRSSSQTTRRGTSFSLIYGKNSNYVQVDYPSPNEYVDNAGLMVLRQAYEILKRNDVVADLPKRLRERVAKADGNSGDAVFEQLMLGYVLWWIDEKEEAVEVLTTAANQLPDDPAYRLETAQLYQLLGDLDTALVIVESITPRDQKLVQQRELMALQLAERLGDIDRARSAAERLFGLRLDNNTQLALVDPMRRLGLLEMAEAIVARVHRRSGNQTSSLASLMALYQGQGKIDLAEQIAHTILRRTKPPLSNASSAGRNPFRYSRRGDGTRNQALRVLQQTGSLKELIQRLESQLERSPDSSRTYEQLVEFYQATNDREQVQSLLAKAVENRPDSVVMRYQLAKQLESTGKIEEACDQYLEVLKLKPGWIADDLHRVRRVFQRTKRSADLVRGFEGINLKSIGRPYYIVDLVSEMLQGRGGDDSEENRQIALDLFERVFHQFPTYRNQLISRIRDPELWKLSRVYELGKRGIIPSASQAVSDPWFGVNQIYSWSSGGRVNAMFEQIINGVKGTENMDDLRDCIEQGIEDVPEWYGGHAMLALIDLKENRRDEAKARLEKLVADEEVVSSMTGDAGWIIGQELDQFEDTRDVAVRLFESALKTSRNMNQIQYSPVVRLVDLYDASGRSDDARALLLKSIDSGLNNFDTDYRSYQRIQNSVWAADKLLTMDFPVDAMKLYREVVDTPEEALTAAQRFGGSRNYIGQSRKGLEKALAALSDSKADEAMNQLLAAREDAKAGTMALDVMLSVPTVSTLRKDSMKSQLAELLDSISSNDDVSKHIDHRLAELHMQFPADLSVAVTRAIHAVDQGHDDVTDVLRELEAVVADNPLDDIPSGRRPNSRQRREAFPSISLWLVARECMSTDEHRELGQKLAQRALIAARRQIKTDHAVAILYEWGQRSIDAGDRKGAEEKWAELLELVTKRPERKQKNAPAGPTRRPPVRNRTGRIDFRSLRQLEAIFVPSTAIMAVVADERSLATPNPPRATRRSAPNGRPSNRVAPLTLSQFRVTIEIALAAANNDMPALSRRAVQKSLEGGVPVPDASTLTNSARSRGLVVPTAIRGTTAEAGATSAIETEVANSLRNVLGRWASRNDYPPGEVYELLHPIIMPSARPAEILMYADSSKLISDAEVKSLGVTLVQWAKRGDRIDDLSQRLNDRKQHDQSLVPALVLESHIAIANDDLKAAGATLNQLADNIQARAIPPMIQLACHAAIPAIAHSELEEPSFRILAFAIDQHNRTQTASQSRNPDLGKLASLVNRHLVSKGNEAAVKQFFEQFLVNRQQYYSRYSGDYGQYIQWQDTARLAEEAAKSGVPALAMDFMGRVADYSHSNYNRPSLKTALAVTCRELSRKTPEERYESWYQWTMPTEGRRTIRLAADFVPPVKVSNAFLDAAAISFKQKQQDFLCNMLELVKAAQESGKLDELRAAAQQAFDDKLENANFLLPIVLVYKGDLGASEPLINDLVKTIAERNKRVNNQPRPSLSGDYAVYRACMEFSKESAKLYGRGRQALRTQARGLQQGRIVANVLNDFARREAADRDTTIRMGDPGLKHWLSASNRNKLEDNSRAWWAVHEDHLLHITGPTAAEFLYFAYPLTGNFEFSVDCFNGNWAESDVTFGGVVVESQSYGSRMRLSTVGGHESFYRKQGFKRNQEQHGRVKVEAKDGKLRYWLNNHVVYEEKLRSTSPWFGLFTEGPRLTSFKNFKLSGNPIVPREVTLIADDQMDGWNTSFFGEKQPRHRLMAETIDDPNSSLAYYQQQEPTEFDWETKNDVLNGTPMPDKSPADQSWIYYHRPLQDDETVRYEFYYLPDKTVAHPTIGRLAMVLRPDGVKSHWIANTWDETLAGVDAANEIVERDYQRSDQLPLQENEWNSVQVLLSDGVVELSLNDTLVFQRPVAEVDRRFGFFRRRQQASRIRNAVLTGNWPETLTDELRDNLLALKSPTLDDAGRLINRMVGDRFFVSDVNEVVKQAQAADDEQAYRLLRDWVLPSTTHETIRVVFDLSPRQSAVALDRDLVCPAIELISVADRIGQLDELREIVDALPTADDLDKRGKQAMQAMIALAANDHAGAKQYLAEIYARLDSGLPKYLNEIDRQVEYVVARYAAEQPKFRSVAQDIAVKMQGKERDDETTKGFHKLVSALVGFTRQQAYRPTTREKLTQWQPVVYDKPDLRALGFRPSAWNYQRGHLSHVPGETWTQLFFQSPIRGKFEIQAERTTHGYQELTIAYGMHAAEPKHDLSSVRVTKLMHQTKDVGGAVQIPRWRDRIGDFRIVVDTNKITTFANGVQIHSQSMSSQPDPWLVLQMHSPDWSGMVNNLRIVGEPEIMEEIKLLEIAGLAGWRADVYGESFSHDGSEAPWKLAGDELQARLSKDRSAINRESLMMYQRPMLEDGEIEFEAFYDPDKVEVHPALGRLAFVIRRDGVKLHHLTDAEWDWEPTLATNNESIVNDDAIPLKQRDWNRYRLVLAANTLTITVNDVEVCQHELDEEPSRRFFGLFRYADKNKSRVRKIVYRGNWPKVFPKVEQQQLASSPEGPMQIAADSLGRQVQLRLNRSLPDLQKQGLSLLGPSERIRTEDNGLRLQLQQANGYASWPGVKFAGPIEQDFAATVEFADLSMKANKDGWGVILALDAALDDDHASTIEIGVAMNKDGKMFAKAQRRHVLPSGKPHSDGWSRTEQYRAGRLQLVRDGGQMHCLIAGKDGDFRLLRTFAVGQAPVKEIAVQNKCSDDVGEIDVLLTNLDLSMRNLENAAAHTSATKNGFAKAAAFD